MTPSCWPFSSMRRTSGTRIRSLIRVLSRSGGRRSNLRGTGTRCCEGSSSGVEHSSGQALGELLDGHRSGVTLAVLADAHRAALGLPVAHDEHVRNLAQLGVADLAPDRLGALVQLG